VKETPICCGREMIACDCGQNAYCPICRMGRGAAPCECSPRLNKELAGGDGLSDESQSLIDEILEEHSGAWERLAEL